MTDPKCEDLIDARLEQRMADLLPDWDDAGTLHTIMEEMDVHEADIDDLQNEYRDRLLEAVLSIEKKTLITVLLSWGGPSDGFDFTFDSDGELDSCEYWYKDWFDGARRDVPLEQAEQLVDLYCIDPKA